MSVALGSQPAYHASAGRQRTVPGSSLREDEALSPIFRSSYDVCFLSHPDSPPEHQSKYYWLQFVIPSLVVLLFAADTGLFISTQQQLTLLLKIKTTRRSRNLMDPRPKPDPKKN